VSSGWRVVVDDSDFVCPSPHHLKSVPYSIERDLLGCHTPVPTPPAPPAEAPGSYSHATDSQFCSSHACIPNFPNGNGYIIQCVDGEWSHSGGLSGACSDHGGEADSLAVHWSAVATVLRAPGEH
jgi:hypothetical protein